MLYIAVVSVFIVKLALGVGVQFVGVKHGADIILKLVPSHIKT